MSMPKTTVLFMMCQSCRQAQLGSVDRSGEFVVVDTWVKDGDAWRLSMRLLARPDPGVGATK